MSNIDIWIFVSCLEIPNRILYAILDIYKFWIEFSTSSTRVLTIKSNSLSLNSSYFKNSSENLCCVNCHHTHKPHINWSSWPSDSEGNSVISDKKYMEYLKIKEKCVFLSDINWMRCFIQEIIKSSLSFLFLVLNYLPDLLTNLFTFSFSCLMSFLFCVDDRFIIFITWLLDGRTRFATCAVHFSIRNFSNLRYLDILISTIFFNHEISKNILGNIFFSILKV